MAPITIAPRMERSGEHRRVHLPIGTGWHAAATNLFNTVEIGPRVSRNRFVGRGDRRRLLAAKHCAPMALPYLLSGGATRGDAGADELDAWHWVPMDLDAIDLDVGKVERIIHTSLGSVCRIVHRTWSARDEYASVRVLLPLSRAATYEEVCRIWWVVRGWLVRAGLPQDSTKHGEPSVDSRLDTRGYFLPARPECPGVDLEGWGGLDPKVYVSPDDTPFIDPDSLALPDAEQRAALDKAHQARWPTVPVPGSRMTGTGVPSVAVDPDDPIWSELTLGREHRCPWCEHETDRVLSVWVRDGVLRATCFGHCASEHSRPNGYTRRAELPPPEQLKATELTEIDSILDDLSAPTKGEETGPEGNGRSTLLTLLDSNRVDRPLRESLATTRFQGRAPVDYDALDPFDEASQPSPADLDHALDVARDRSPATWDAWIACDRGRLIVAKPGGSEVKSVRVCCGSYSCPTCGPKLTEATSSAFVAEAIARQVEYPPLPEPSAALVDLVAEFEEEEEEEEPCIKALAERRQPLDWVAVSIKTQGTPAELEAAHRRLKRWRYKAPESRWFAGFTTSPSAVTWVLHAPWDHFPSAGKGLAQELLKNGVWGVLGILAEDAVSNVNLDSLVESRDRIVLVRGPRVVTKRIAQLKDFILKRPKQYTSAGGFRAYTNTTLAELAEDAAPTFGQAIAVKGDTLSTPEGTTGVGFCRHAREQGWIRVLSGKWKPWADEPSTTQDGLHYSWCLGA